MDQNLKKQVCFKENNLKKSSVILIQTLLWWGCVDFERGLLFDIHVWFFHEAKHGSIYILLYCDCIYTAKCTHASRSSINTNIEQFHWFVLTGAIVLGMNLHILVKLHALGPLSFQICISSLILVYLSRFWPAFWTLTPFTRLNKSFVAAPSCRKYRWKYMEERITTASWKQRLLQLQSRFWSQVLFFHLKLSEVC